MSRRVLGECVEQAALDAAGLVPVRADRSGPAQIGQDGLGRDQDDGRLGNFDPRAHWFTASSARSQT